MKSRRKSFAEKASKKYLVAKIIVLLSKRLSIFLCSSGQAHEYLVEKKLRKSSEIFYFQESRTETNEKSGKYEMDSNYETKFKEEISLLHSL